MEQNFGFLKDPVIVNALFLKSPRRIEALGLILVLALMIWRLMERTMRVSLKESNSKVVGWNNRQTSRPTSFMMTTKFVSVIVIRTAERRFLAEPLDPIQERYLQILGLSAGCFHQSLCQRQAARRKPDATAKRHRMRPPIPTCRSQHSLLSPASPGTTQILLSARDCKNGLKRLIPRSTKRKNPGLTAFKPTMGT